MFNLRGNCRTSGEQRRKESGNVFGEGSRTPISITILVRKPKKDPDELAAILYKDIGDYLTREDKLKTIKDFGSMLSASIGLSSIAPNEAGDWINQRDGLFETFIPISQSKKYDHKAQTFFVTDTNGIQTNRDSWVYNFSVELLRRNVELSIRFYAAELKRFNDKHFANRKDAVADFINSDPRQFSWTRSTKGYVARNIEIPFCGEHFRIAQYRPFCKANLYFDKFYNEYPNQLPKFFPTPQSKNLVICISGVGVTKEFSCIMVDTIPDLELIGKSQCFPLYWYEKNERDALSLFDSCDDDYTRHSGVTDFILQRAREEFGPKVSAEDVFYYVYGLLHSEEYRKRFSSDLKKSLARIPLVASTQDFKAFVKAGRKLADLHLNYETGPLCQQLIITGDKPGKLNVTKMRFPSKEDKGTILFNDSVKIENIPMTAYDYVVNGKSAVEWIMERYAVTKNADSGIVNDPNLWSDNPRYILDLVSRVIQMSVETQKIVSGLPKLDFSSQKS